MKTYLAIEEIKSTPLFFEDFINILLEQVCIQMQLPNGPNNFATFICSKELALLKSIQMSLSFEALYYHISVRNL